MFDLNLFNLNTLKSNVDSFMLIFYDEGRKDVLQIELAPTREL